MNIKQEEGLDILEDVFKNEPELVSVHMKQTYKEEDDDDFFDEFETNKSGQNIEIKEEIIECDEPKIEYRSDLLSTINNASASGKMRFCATAATVKKELKNTDEVDIKEDISEYNQPSMNNKSTEYQESLTELCDRENNERLSNTLKNDANVINIIKKRKQCRYQKSIVTMGSRTIQILENATNSVSQNNIDTVDIENTEFVFEEDLNHPIIASVVGASNQVLSQSENDPQQVCNDLDIEENQNEFLNASDLIENLQPSFPAVMPNRCLQNNSPFNNIDLSPRQNQHSHSENEEKYIPDRNIESGEDSNNADSGDAIQSKIKNDEEYIPDLCNESDTGYIQPNKESVEPEATEVDENAEENLSKRKREKTNQRHLNKRLRMQGQEYLGFRKPRNQRNTFNDTKRAERRLKPRCDCRDKKKLLRKCKLIVENYRVALFNDFWSKMTWDERKVFVCNTVTIKKSNNRTSDSRRTTTLIYTLKVNHQIVPVCKKMYLNTTGLGEWSVRNWVLNSSDGVVERQESTVLE
ncbi:unnamed protein product [Psylliodes chrysocephalus]|uniref:Uncharacterized protein n=1 Tax=Psylliodes chrysocephalus TaxID=3402493 RepID=A0A9P0CXY4_9CUCU|nr:unnamed protein product [Psylliodes chrysocephala]